MTETDALRGHEICHGCTIRVRDEADAILGTLSFHYVLRSGRRADDAPSNRSARGRASALNPLVGRRDAESPDR